MDEGCAGRHAVIDMICPVTCAPRGLKKLEAVIQKPGRAEMAHGSRAEDLPFLPLFIIFFLLAAWDATGTWAHGPGTSRGRLRNMGHDYTKSSKINRNRDEEKFKISQLAFISPRAR